MNKNTSLNFVLSLTITVFLSLCFVGSAFAGDGKYVILDVENPEFHYNELFPAFETYHSPRIWKLRERYNLDAVVEGETDEFKRIMLLRNWIYSNIEIENRNPTIAREDTFAILDAALKGGLFHCTHFSLVQHAILNSYGYVCRRLGAGPGLKTNGGHHGVNEVWVNKFCKWVLIDAKYDNHFEKDGVPLSALEVRDEMWKNDGKDVKVVVGLDRKPDTINPETGKPNVVAGPHIYRWCSWEPDTNRFTAYPAHTNLNLIMFEDDIYRNNTWYRGGRPHWAYNTPHLITTTIRGCIEWTPNVIRSDVKIATGTKPDFIQVGDGRGEMKAYESQINGDSAIVFLVSFTPNFKTYQVKKGDGQWLDCDEVVEVRLKKELNRFTFRTVNLFGVTGPEHRIEIEWQEN